MRELCFPNEENVLEQNDCSIYTGSHGNLLPKIDDIKVIDEDDFWSVTCEFSSKGAIMCPLFHAPKSFCSRYFIKKILPDS